MTAIDAWNPVAVILLGTAFGKDDDEMTESCQYIGDILVSDQIADYESGKIRPENFHSTGPTAESGRALKSIFKNYEKSWVHNINGRKAKCEFGTILSGDRIVDDKVFKENLFARYPGAIGGEMEGRGAYAACRNKGINEWIVVKAICSWGQKSDGFSKDRSQKCAAESVVSLLKHIFSQSGLLERIRQTRKVVDVTIKAPNTLPRAISQLFGRENEIEFVKDLILKNKEQKIPAVVISSFDGMPAIGKTALAVWIAHSLTLEYPDAQLYIDCYGYTAGQTPLSSEKILDSLLLALGIKNVPQDYIDKLNLWRDKLSNKKVIIIFDNVKDVSQINDLIPASHESLILVTSRNRLTNLFGVKHLCVNVLDEPSSINLLKETSGFHDDKYQSIFLDIAKKFGYLPKALEIIGTRIRGRSFKYIKDLLELNSPLYSLEISKNNSVYEAFGISYNLLSEGEKDIIQMAAITPGASFTSESCAALLGTDVRKAFTALETLYDQRLIEEVGEDRYRLHDLIRDFSREKFYELHSKQEENDAIMRLIDYYSSCVNHCNKILYPESLNIGVNVDTIVGTIRLNSTKEECLTWLREELENILACLKIAEKNNWYEKYLKLSYTVPYYFRSWVPSWRILEIQKVSYDFAIKNGDQIKIAVSLTGLGIAQRQVGDFSSALKTLNGAVTYWRSLECNDGLAYALNVYGSTLQMLGEYSSALINLEEALSIYKKTGNKYGIAFMLNNEGWVYYCMKKYEIAKNMFKQSIKNWNGVTDCLNINNTAGNLAITYLKLGNYTKAHKTMEKARKAMEKTLQIFKNYSNYSKQALALNYLGDIEIFGENYEAAIKYTIKARKIASIVDDEYNIGKSFYIQGEAYLKLKNEPEAKKCLNEALKIFEKMKVVRVISEIKELLQSDLVKNG